MGDAAGSLPARYKNSREDGCFKHGFKKGVIQKHSLRNLKNTLDPVTFCAMFSKVKQNVDIPLFVATLMPFGLLLTKDLGKS